jgi:hypothetical protein
LRRPAVTDSRAPIGVRTWRRLRPHGRSPA